MSVGSQPIYSGLNGGNGDGRSTKDGRPYVRARDEASGELVSMSPDLWDALKKIMGNKRISGTLRVGIQAGNVTHVYGDNIDLKLLAL